MGRCFGGLSWCNLGGYALETKCHTGKVALYNEKEYKGMDTQNRAPKEFKHVPGQSFHPGDFTEMRFHSIDYMTQTYFETWDYVPTFQVQNGCEDCGHWKYF